MKPQHLLMLRKVGKGLRPRVFEKGQMRTHDVREGERPIEKLTEDMAGMGLKKAKRKPLKFKL
jgi:hypothetical protein